MPRAKSYRDGCLTEHCYRACVLISQSLATEQAAAVPVASFACNRSRIYLRTQNDHAPHITANRHTHTHTHIHLHRLIYPKGLRGVFYSI